MPANRPSGRAGSRVRLESEQAATFALLQALRHAGVSEQVASTRVQREPFSQRGLVVNDFVPGRFSPTQMYHVEVVFAEERGGVTAIGDGRWLGLGVMRPVYARFDADVDPFGPDEPVESLEDGDGEGDSR